MWSGRAGCFFYFPLRIDKRIYGAHTRDMTTTQNTAAPYRAGYKGQKIFCLSLADAARIILEVGGGSIDKLAGSLYRTISGREQDTAVEAARIFQDGIN